jgi:hypothetical protein
MLKDDLNIIQAAEAAGDATREDRDRIGQFRLPHIPSRQHQLLDQGQRCSFYMAGSRGHQNLFQPMGFTAYQAGITGRRCPDDRIEDKRFRRYASVLIDPNDPQNNAQSLMWGHDIFLIRITPEMLGGAEIPKGFAIENGVIAFRLMPGVTVEQVDKAVSRMLAARSVNTFLGSGDGQKRMAEAGHDPRLRLHTAYSDIGRSPRYSLAEEVYLIRPKREMAKLIKALADTLSGLVAR